MDPLPLKAPDEPASDKIRSDQFAQALLNILDDFSSEKNLLSETQVAVVNILEDFSEEKTRLEETQKAVLNILDDFIAERRRLEETQKAILNILEDFETEKNKVELVNRNLRREVGVRAIAEKALSEKGLALQRSNSELEQFAYVASHDLQEPLRMVSSYVQLLGEKYQSRLGPEADKYIKYAVEGVQRMHSLIAGLLEYSRVGREERVEKIEIKDAVELAIDNLQTAISSSGANVKVGELPLAMADNLQLAQVFQNLIGNAIKFAKAGETPVVQISASRIENETIVSVADNGIGILPKHAERIFMIFQRLHDRTKYAGTGIGLAICKKVVEQFHGRIWLDENSAGGATFHFSLPSIDR